MESSRRFCNRLNIEFNEMVTTIYLNYYFAKPAGGYFFSNVITVEVVSEKRIGDTSNIAGNCTG